MAHSRLSTPDMTRSFSKEARGGLRLRRSLRESGVPLPQCDAVASAAFMAGANPWDPLQPSAAGALAARLTATGAAPQEVQEMCDLFEKPLCFVQLSEAVKIADIQAKLSQTNLDIEILQMEKDTADITHPFYLTQKCQALKMMNSHLEALLKEKRALRQRLAKPLCQESLPIEAIFHRYAVELLALAVAFIEKLEAHLTTVRNIPQLPLTMKNMDSALAKVDLLVIETEKLAEQILQWRVKQKDIFSDNSWISVGSNSCFRSLTLE